MKEKSLDLKYSCQNCKKVFSCRQNLYKHKLSCEKAKTLTCHCGKSFARRDNLNRHKSKCTGQIKLKNCQVCGKHFTKPSNLKRHLQLHLKEKETFSCKCGKKYCRNDKYLIHIQQCTSKYTSETKDDREDKENESFVIPDELGDLLANAMILYLADTDFGSESVSIFIIILIIFKGLFYYHDNKEIFSSMLDSF